MFLVIGRAEEKLLVLDTTDSVVEAHSIPDLKRFVQEGIEIRGFSRGKDGILDVRVQRGVIPSNVTQLLKDYSKRWEATNGEDAEFVLESMVDFMLHTQVLGENLSKKYGKMSFNDFSAIYRRR